MGGPRDYHTKSNKYSVFLLICVTFKKRQMDKYKKNRNREQTSGYRRGGTNKWRRLRDPN